MLKAFIAGTALKIIISVIALLFVSLITKKKIRQLSVAVIIILIASIFGAVIAQNVPSLQEEVTITALGKKGKDAKSSEVFINGFTVNGKDAEIGRVIDGRWFYNGRRYAWRKESDPRKPGELTRSVTLAIPVGWDRTVNFSSSEYRGYAKVTFNGKSRTIDTSAESAAPIYNSSRRLLLFNEGIKLSAYFLTVLFATLLLLFAYRNEQRSAAWIKKYRWQLTYAGIALGQLFFSVAFSEKDSFWLDELWNIGMNLKYPGLIDRLMCGDVPQPLNGLFSYLVFHTMPDGEKWLLLPSEIITACGIYMTAMCARQCKDGKTGLIAALTTACSFIVLGQCSQEFRNYSFYFFFSATYLYFHIRRLRNAGKESWREIIGLSLLMTVYSNLHYHAVITCIGLFIPDAYLYFRKKIRLRCVIPYLVAAASYLPTLWILLNHPQTNDFSWQPVPSVKNVITLLHYLTAETRIAFLLFALGGLGSIVVCFMGDKQTGQTKDNIFTKNLSVCIVLLFTLFFSIAFFFIYGNYINQKGTLWVLRYFIDLIPYAAVITGTGVAFLRQYVFPSRKILNLTMFVLIVAILFESTNADLEERANSMREPYEVAADWLYSQNDIFNEDTIIVLGNNEYVTAGFNEYYITWHGKRDALNVQAWETVEESGSGFSQYNTVYFLYQHNSNTERFIETGLLDQFSITAQNEKLKIDKYVRTE